jgi:hypothetical protein
MDEIVIQFGIVPKIYAGQELAQPYVLSGYPMFLGYAPWPSQPDLLCQDNIFYGLTYNVGVEYLDDVQRWVSEIGSDRVRLVKVSEPGNYYEYEGTFGTEYYLEIIWTLGEPNRMIFGSLSEDAWLYREDRRDSNPFDAASCVMLMTVDSILEDFDLQLPDVYIPDQIFIG